MLPPQEYLELKDVRSGCKSAKMQPPLPGFDPFAASGAELLELSVRMLPGLSPGSLRPFLTAVRALYNPNPYHNFKHAVHVTINCARFLEGVRPGLLRPVHRCALLLAALCHDVGHYGVPNSTLVRQRSPLAEVYHNRSVAENYSADTSLGVLGGPAGEDLLREIESVAAAAGGGGDDDDDGGDGGGDTKASGDDDGSGGVVNFRRVFRHLIMATDIADPEAVQATRAGWAASADALREAAATPGRRLAEAPATSLMQMVLLCADVGIVTETLPVFAAGVHRLYLELASSDAGCALEGFVANQRRFMRGYAADVLTHARGTGLLPAMDAAAQRLDANCCAWDALSNDSKLRLVSECAIPELL